MTGEMFTFAGSRVYRGSVTIPAYGLWAGDLYFADDATLPSSAPLVLGDLTMPAHVYRTRAFAGHRNSRVVGGLAGGWMLPVTAQEYANPPGLTLSLVLGDLAASVGERVTITGDHAFGAFFFRRAGPAKRVLDQLAGPTGWWLDPTTGVVQVGATRRSDPISTAFTVHDFNGETGRATISTENPADWMPGRTWTAPTVTDPQTISTVWHTIDEAGTMRTTVLSAGPETADDRLMAPLRDLVESLAPDVVYAGIWEYVVQATDGKTIDAHPSTSAVLTAPFPLPQHVTGIPMRPGVAGCAMSPAVGSTVLVAFANGDPSRPRIIGYDSTAATSINVNPGGSSAARTGDDLNAGYLVVQNSPPGALVPAPYYPGTAAGLVAAGIAAAALTPPGYVVPMVAGRITGGSSTVFIG